MQPDLHLRLLTGTAKREAPSALGLPVPLAEANLETLPAMAIQRPGWNRLVQARHLAAQDWDSRQAEQDLVQVRHPAARVKPSELQRQLAEGSAVLQARVRRYWRGPGPCAFSQEIPADRKCNRAARCGDRPIFARYRPPRNRRAPADCDNKCSRSRRKRVRRAPPFLIAAEDKYLCLPRRIGD